MHVIEPSVDEMFLAREMCALCGSKERSVHINFRDLPVMRCDRCGFLYSGKIMSEAGLRRYYEGSFGGERHLHGQAVNARMNAVALRYLVDLKNIRSWLDIGTGYGFLLKWLREKHNIVTEGVELSAQEARFSQEKFGLCVHENSLSEATLSADYYDVVSCFEVIEHIPNPVAFVSELFERVRPGGQLLIMTDNFASKPVQTMRGRFPKWIPHTHISHFTPNSLQDCLSKVSGLTIEKAASFTPLDMLARQILSMVRPPLNDDDAFNLEAEMSSEMSGKYRFYVLRYLINPIWTSLNIRPNLDHGTLMYALCRKAEG